MEGALLADALPDSSPLECWWWLMKTIGPDIGALLFPVALCETRLPMSTLRKRNWPYQNHIPLVMRIMLPLELGQDPS
jgi:hypothetical protein